MNMIAGCMLLAILKSMRTSFSDSPCHREVSDEAEMLKKVALASAASACRTHTSHGTLAGMHARCTVCDDSGSDDSGSATLDAMPGLQHASSRTSITTACHSTEMYHDMQ